MLPTKGVDRMITSGDLKMEAEQTMRELESATQIVLAPPDFVTAEQRHAAEKIFLAFRKSKAPYDFCRYILEHSKCDYVLFQAATTIKECVVREWNLLRPQDTESLRSFLLHFITQNICLQSYVREQILQTVAVILKRGTIDTKTTGCDSLFQDVAQLVHSGNVTMQLVSCSMLNALLNEYSTACRMSNVGFTWEFHIKCKRAFEVTDLKKVFLFSMQVLHTLEQEPSPLTREATAVFNRFLSITEHVLSWEFTPKNQIGSFEGTQNGVLKPKASWKDALLDTDLLHLFFKIHQKVRHNSEMAHHSLQCLTQLASLSGPIFPNADAQVSYLHTYIQAFLQMLASIDLQDYEYLGIANIFKNLILIFPSSCFSGLPELLCQALIEKFTKLTCVLAQAAALEESIHKDETLHMEAYEKMLESWLELMSAGMPSYAFLKPCALEVFNTYMQCHIGPPDGTRYQSGSKDIADEDDFDEIDEEDRDRFYDQLVSIGHLARICPEQSVPPLTKLLEDRVSRLSDHFSQSHSNASLSSSTLFMLHEDIHWILLVAGHVLTGEDENANIMPDEIMSYSIRQSKLVDVMSTLKALASPGQRRDMSENSGQTVDTVVRFITAVFQLCEVERRAIEAHLVDSLSPLVESTVMWFLRKWTLCYLLPDENNYKQMSIALTAAFGRDTEGAQWCLKCLLDKVVSNISMWHSEEKLILDTLQLLVSLVEQKSKRRYVIKCDSLWNLARLEANNLSPVNLLPSTAKRYLLQALVLAGSGNMEMDTTEEYWKLVLQSVKERFSCLISQGDLLQARHTGHAKVEIINLLESLCGIALASCYGNINRLFNFLQPLLVNCIQLLDLYHNYEDIVPLILELFNEVVRKQLPFLNEHDTHTLYEMCMNVIQTYSKHNIGRRFVNVSEEEESKFNDLLLVMDMLSNLLEKDFLDFSDDVEIQTFGVSPAKAPTSTLSAGEVVLHGVNIVIPLMTDELFKFPTLCQHYYKLVTFLSECHPEKFSILPENLFKTLMTSIEHGLSKFGSDITTYCLNFIRALGEHTVEEEQVGSMLHQAMGQFLKVVLRLFLVEMVNMDHVLIASDTLFCLICCHQDLYQKLVCEVIENQQEAEYKRRLIDAFNRLTPPTLNLTEIKRENRLAFMHNFEQFLLDVRGFLCIR